MSSTTNEFLVYGRVQGVSYRYWALKTARALGVTGFVKNLEDGTVKVVVSGTSTQQAEFLQACKKGPPLAKVHDVRVNKLPYTPYEQFTIR